MSTWHRGRQILAQRVPEKPELLKDFLKRIAADPPLRVPGTAVFLTIHRDNTPSALLHQLVHSRALHEQVIVLTVVTEEVPRVPAVERFEITDLSSGFHSIIVYYGFMQSPNVPVALRECEALGLKINFDDLTYYLTRASLIPSDERPGMALWRDHLFAFMSRNSAWPTAFYHLPPENVIELGIQVEL